jgi:hypothetical protein
MKVISFAGSTPIANYIYETRAPTTASARALGG